MKLLYARLLLPAGLVALSACYSLEERPNGHRIQKGFLVPTPDESRWKHQYEKERTLREEESAAHLHAERDRETRIQTLERKIEQLTQQLTTMSHRLESVEVAHADAQRSLQAMAKEYSEVSLNVGRLREEIHGTPDASDGLKKNLARVEKSCTDFQKGVEDKVSAVDKRATALAEANRIDKEAARHERNERNKKLTEMEAALKESEKNARILEEKLRAAAQEDFKDFIGILVTLTAAMYLGTGGMIVAFFVGRRQSTA